MQFMSRGNYKLSTRRQLETDGLDPYSAFERKAQVQQLLHIQGGRALRRKLSMRM